MRCCGPDDRGTNRHPSVSIALGELGDDLAGTIDRWTP